MKESRIIIIISLLLMLIIPPFFYYLNICGLLNSVDCFNIATNLYCGIIVGLITAICQFFVYKRKIINTVYGLYFDLYRTYYTSKNKMFLFHYNVINIYKKMIELNPKITEVLDEYHGLFREKDKMYRKMNPVIYFGDEYKGKNIIKTLFWFNKKSFEKTIGSYINEIEKILTNINDKRFQKDKQSTEKMFNYLWK